MDNVESQPEPSTVNSEEATGVFIVAFWIVMCLLGTVALYVLSAPIHQEKLMEDQSWNHRPDLNTREMFIRIDDKESGHVFSIPVDHVEIDWLPVIVTLAIAFVVYCVLAIAGILPLPFQDTIMEDNELNHSAKQWVKEAGMLLIFWAIALSCVALSIIIAPLLAGMPRKQRRLKWTNLF